VTEAEGARRRTRNLSPHTGILGPNTLGLQAECLSKDLVDRVSAHRIERAQTRHQTRNRHSSDLLDLAIDRGFNPLTHGDEVAGSSSQPDRRCRRCARRGRDMTNLTHVSTTLIPVRFRQ
jgi:hypothetical protein